MVRRKDLLIKGITTKAAAPAWLSLPRLRERAFHRVLRFLLLTPRTCVCVTCVCMCVHTCARACAAGVVQGLLLELKRARIHYRKLLNLIDIPKTSCFY